MSISLRVSRPVFRLHDPEELGQIFLPVCIN